MFRSAVPADTDAITAIYDALHTESETGRAVIGWIRGVYPTRATAESAIARGEMYVQEEEGRIVAAAKLNHAQEESYQGGRWACPAQGEEVFVLHTLVVDPAAKGKGYGTAFVAFYEAEAKRRGCKALRMDTNARNQAARTLYRKLGYKEVGIVPTVFNGIPDVNLVLLEKAL